MHHPFLLVLPYWLRDRMIQQYGSIEACLEGQIPVHGCVGIQFVEGWGDSEPERYFFPGVDPSVVED